MLDKGFNDENESLGDREINKQSHLIDLDKNYNLGNSFKNERSGSFPNPKVNVSWPEQEVEKSKGC